MSRHKNNFFFSSAQIKDLSILQRFKMSCMLLPPGLLIKIIRPHRRETGRRPVPLKLFNNQCLLRCFIPEISWYIHQIHINRRKFIIAAAMICMSMCQYHFQRFVCQRSHKCCQITKSITRINQQCLLLAYNQCCINIARFIDMVNILCNFQWFIVCITHLCRSLSVVLYQSQCLLEYWNALSCSLNQYQTHLCHKHILLLQRPLG